MDTHATDPTDAALLFESSEVRIHWSGRRLWLTPKTALFWWLGAAMAIISGLAFAGDGIATWGAWTLSATEQIALDVLAWVAGVGALLMLGAGARRRATARPACFDFDARVLTTGRHSVGFAQIDRVLLDVKTVGATETVGVAIETGGRTLMLMPHQAAWHAADLLATVARIQIALTNAGATISEDILPADTDAPPPTDRGVGLGLLLVGLAWVTLGFAFGRGWVWALDDVNGLLIWPLGGWLAALGAGELAGVPVIQTLLEGKWRYRAPLLLAVAGTYLWVCIRPLN